MLRRLELHLITLPFSRAIDSDGNTLEFRLSAKRDADAAQGFFEKTLGAPHTVQPRVINVDKNAAYPKAVDTLKTLEHLPAGCELRQVKYLNNRIEQDHRAIKCRVRPMLAPSRVELRRFT